MLDNTNSATLHILAFREQGGKQGEDTLAVNYNVLSVCSIPPCCCLTLWGVCYPLGVNFQQQ